MRRNRVYWICQISGWLLYAAINTGFGLAFQAFAWRIIGTSLLLSTLGLAATHVYRHYLKRYNGLAQPLPRLIVLILASSIGIAVLLTASMTLLNLLLIPAFTLATFQWGVAAIMIFNLSITVLTWSTIYVGLHYFWNYRHLEVEKWRLEATLKETELKALKAQLNPHFLFNSLNSVRALIAEDQTRAQEAVTLLARLLRSSLHVNSASTIPLRAELQTVEDYLSLEAIRLEERLRYRIEAAPEDVANAPLIPPMLIQTLVENAIKHGVANRPEGGFVHIGVSLKENQFVISVVNSGQLVRSASSTHVGLANARERLDLLFGSSASLTLVNASSTTVEAKVVLPVAALTPPVPALA